MPFACNGKAFCKICKEGLEEVRNIPMMGAYIFYYKERIFVGIYGSGFRVKVTENIDQLRI